jgi:hypothetical protein
MASDGATVDRLRTYLRDLRPEARALLTKELERGLLRGDEGAGSDLILPELRRLMREQRDGAPRYGNAARLFYMPLEPFMVDDLAQHNHPNRIARAALEPLWTFIRRDVVPDEAKAFADEVNAALAANEPARADLAACRFQDRVVDAIHTVLRKHGDDDKARRRLFAQVGTPRSHVDVDILVTVLSARDTLAMMRSQLPGHIDDFTAEHVDDCKILIETVAARSRNYFPYALLTVMSRLTRPWQLVRLAVKAAGSDAASRVADTPYALAVNIVLAELARLVGELRNDLHAGGAIGTGALLKTIHDTARGLRTEISLAIDSAWGRELSAQRAQISDLLRVEIESMPGRVRRLLRPRPSAEIRVNSTLDETDIAETEALLEFVSACRLFAGELALNEVTQRTYSDLQQYLDSSSGPLLDALRHAGNGDRSFRASQVDAMVRFCGKVLGPDYGAMMSKAAEVARNPDRNPDRKAAAQR